METLQPNELIFHHVGLLTEDIENSIDQYTRLFGQKNISEIVTVETQKVKVCFVKNGVESYIELIQPTSEDSVVYKLLKRKINYYHVAYYVSDIHATVARLEQLGYKPMEFFSSEAFGGKACIFLFSPETHLIELIQK